MISDSPDRSQAESRPTAGLVPGARASRNRFNTSFNTKGAYRFRPDGKRFGLRVVVGRLATLKVDQASIAEAQFSLAA